MLLRSPNFRCQPGRHTCEPLNSHMNYLKWGVLFHYPERNAALLLVPVLFYFRDLPQARRNHICSLHLTIKYLWPVQTTLSTLSLSTLSSLSNPAPCVSKVSLRLSHGLFYTPLRRTTQDDKVWQKFKIQWIKDLRDQRSYNRGGHAARLHSVDNK